METIKKYQAAESVCSAGVSLGELCRCESFPLKCPLRVGFCGLEWVQVQVISRAWLDVNSLGSKTNAGNELDPAESKDMVCVIVPTHSLL